MHTGIKQDAAAFLMEDQPLQPQTQTQPPPPPPPPPPQQQQQPSQEEWQSQKMSTRKKKNKGKNSINDNAYSRAYQSVGFEPINSTGQSGSPHRYFASSYRAMPVAPWMTDIATPATSTTAATATVQDGSHTLDNAAA
jgi:hypothetical protein